MSMDVVVFLNRVLSYKANEQTSTAFESHFKSMQKSERVFCLLVFANWSVPSSTDQPSVLFGYCFCDVYCEPQPNVNTRA